MLCIKCMAYHNLGWIFISLVIQTCLLYTSIKAVDDPSNAVIHIQNTAPAPPADIAAKMCIRDRS